MTSDQYAPASKEEQNYYNDILRKFASGAGMTEEELKFHVGFQNRNIHSGIAVGESAPDFELPDQTGALQRLGDLMGPNGMVLSFTRTTWWCPYCRNQIKDLDLAADLLKEKGVSVCAITPDSVDVHRLCANTYGLRYPVLSDEGSKVIETFGIVNTAIPEDVPSQRFRMPFPGSYFIDPQGVVQTAVFLANYEYRQSPTVPVMSRFGVSKGVPSARLELEDATVELHLSTGKTFPGHEIGLTCSIIPRDGRGLLLPPQGDGPRIGLDGQLLAHEATVLPSHRAAEAGRHTIDMLVPLRWSAPTEFDYIRGLEHLARDRIKPGPYRLRGVVEFSVSLPDGARKAIEEPFQLQFDVLANLVRPDGLGPKLETIGKVPTE